VSQLVIAAALGTAAVLLRAAIGKVRRPGDLAATIARLGMPRTLSAPAAAAVIAAEFAGAFLLLFRPAGAATQLALLGLAVVFAAAGLRAMRLGERIACNCFGTGSATLGSKQVLMLIPWAAVAAMLRAGATPLSGEAGAASFAVTAAGVAALEVTGVIRALLESRGDRHAVQEMHPWLPSY
jgi:hypothetical protein